MALFVFTLVPSVGPHDSGELVVVANGLGVAHPPGFPLYMLVAHAATWLPLGNIAQRVNLVSAVFGALATAMLALLVQLIVTTPGRQAWTGGLAAAVAAIAFAGSRTFWSYATVAEVYTLNLFLIITVFAMLVAWRRREGMGGDSRPLLLYTAALCFGLGLAVHHVTVLLTLPAFLYLILAHTGPRFLRSRELGVCLAALSLGLLIYVYLPLAALSDPVLNWGDPRTLRRLWWHVSGREYHSYFNFSMAGFVNEASAFAQRLAFEFGPSRVPAVLALSAIGLLVLYRRDRKLFVTVLLLVGCNLGYSLAYNTADDRQAYQLMTFAACAITAGVGVHALLDWGRQWHPALRAGTGLGLALLPLMTIAANLPYSDRRNDFVAHDYADNVLKTMVPGGMLLTLDWQVGAPLLYLRHVEEVRRDVIAIHINLLRRSWYYAYLRREYPQLMQATQRQADAFLEDLRSFEADPQLYARDAALGRRIDDRFLEMLFAFITEQMRHGALYLTQEIVTNEGPVDLRLTQALNQRFQMVPAGLLFQVFADRQFHDLARPPLAVRGLADGSMAFAPDSVVELEIRPVYRTMLYNRGLYLAHHGRHDLAREDFRTALAIDPAFDLARQALAE